MAQEWIAGHGPEEAEQVFHRRLSRDPGHHCGYLTARRAIHRIVLQVVGQRALDAFPLLDQGLASRLPRARVLQGGDDPGEELAAAQATGGA